MSYLSDILEYIEPLTHDLDAAIKSSFGHRTTLVVRGVSGIAVGSALRSLRGYSLIYVPKPGESMHRCCAAPYSTGFSVADTHIIFLDDMLSSGDTLRACVDHPGVPELDGMILYFGFASERGRLVARELFPPREFQGFDVPDTSFVGLKRSQPESPPDHFWPSPMLNRRGYFERQS